MKLSTSEKIDRLEKILLGRYLIKVEIPSSGHENQYPKVLKYLERNIYLANIASKEPRPARYKHNGLIEKIILYLKMRCSSREDFEL